MAHDASVAGLLGSLDGLERLGERANLVDLDQDRIGGAQLDALLEALGVGDEQVVAHQLHLIADTAGELNPTVPVLLCHTILDGDDGIGVDELLPVIDHLGARVLHALALELVHTGLGVVELGRCRIHGVHEVDAGLKASLLHGLGNVLERLGVGLEIGREAALVAHAAAQAGLVQHALEGAVDLGAPAQALGKARSTHGHNHELLEVNVVVGMHAAVEDVHHGRGQQVGVNAAQILVQRQARRLCRSAGNGQRYAQNGVGAELGFVGRAVGGNQRGVNGTLIEGIEAHDGIGALVVDMLDGLRNALAQVTTLVAVAQLASFESAGRSARRHHRAAEAAVLEHDLDLDGGVAAAVEHFATVDVQNIAHVVSLSLGNGLNVWRPTDRAPSVCLRKLAMSHFLHYALS